MTTTLLATDASNRALRSLLQGLAIDVAVGVALALTAYFATRNNWGDMEWALLGFSVAKSAVQAVCAYIMRRWLDPSRIPTPLPPAPVAPPAQVVTQPGNGTAAGSGTNVTVHPPGE
jgi:hypothetical protein